MKAILSGESVIKEPNRFVAPCTTFLRDLSPFHPVRFDSTVQTCSLKHNGNVISAKTAIRNSLHALRSNAFRYL